MEPDMQRRSQHIYTALDPVQSGKTSGALLHSVEWSWLLVSLSAVIIQNCSKYSRAKPLAPCFTQRAKPPAPFSTKWSWLLVSQWNQICYALNGSTGFKENWKLLHILFRNATIIALGQL